MTGTGMQGWAEFFSPPRRSTNSVRKKSRPQPDRRWWLGGLLFIRMDSGLGNSSARLYPDDEGAIFLGCDNRNEIAGWPLSLLSALPMHSVPLAEAAISPDRRDKPT